MEVSINVSLEPGYRTGIYALFVNAVLEDGGKAVATRDLVYDLLDINQPAEDTDIYLWAIQLLRAAATATDDILTDKRQRGQERVTVNDFKPLIS